MATAEVSALSDKNENDPKDPPPGDDGSMTLWEHLEELRGRIVRMALAFLVGAGVCWYYKENILAWVTKPYLEAWIRGGHKTAASLHFGSPPALFIAYIRLAALSGLVFAL